MFCQYLFLVIKHILSLAERYMYGEINFRVQEFIHVSQGQRPKRPIKQNINKHII